MDIVASENKSQSGFTLVELAIVMIIIGLLIGGVLKGQQLIANAKISATITEVNGFIAAMHSFTDTYSNLPGDMRNAETRLSGCTGDNFCEGGDGNGLIWGNGDGSAVLLAGVWGQGQNDVGSEQAQFFKHLALADLITGVDTSATLVAWGELYPAAAIRGGYSIQNVAHSGNDSPGGLVLRLHNSLAGNVEGIAGGGNASLSSLEAGNIDRKLDDGIPHSGWVTGAGNPNPPHCEEAYDGSKTKDCTLFFKIGG